MGDLGYFDQNGLLRFLGRKAERIITKNGPLETERCEPIVNAINGVFRSALIGIETGNLQEPCLVVELDNKKTNKIKIKSEILEKLNTFLPNYQIKHIVFEISLPVDKRHNAKIHRLALSKKWTKRFKHASSLTS
jgi:acyl-coenzyme A synthetase/AMP-(fatty) acid ligase